MTDVLPHGMLGEQTVHLCLDMQVLFASQTEWHVPWIARVLPGIAKLCETHAARTVFTRFIPPQNPALVQGAWQRYFKHWQKFTREKIDPGLLELVPELKGFVPPGRVVDKDRYSAFSSPAAVQLLKARQASALVITGSETDVCVLATVLDAVDRGYRVVVAADAVCSGADETHSALMTLYGRRFQHQIEVAKLDDILRCWPE